MPLHVGRQLFRDHIALHHVDSIEHGTEQAVTLIEHSRPPALPAWQRCWRRGVRKMGITENADEDPAALR
jgi:hypothetical protein